MQIIIEGVWLQQKCLAKKQITLKQIVFCSRPLTSVTRDINALPLNSLCTMYNSLQHSTKYNVQFASQTLSMASVTNLPGEVWKV